MYAWAGLAWQFDPDCMSVTDSDGWTCFIMDENEWMDLDAEMDVFNY
jgi:hypothetical protein